MELHGKNIIDGQASGLGDRTFFAFNPTRGEKMPEAFYEATGEEIARALESANAAFQQYRNVPAETIAFFLEEAGKEIVNLGDELIQRAMAETGLPQARLEGERTRTVNQLSLFANLIREGSWREATIDRAIPDRKPVPKPDLRRILIPIGPVVVFAASNFPLAFSVAGGDTASALAAGNPVIVKAHPSHPGTSELTARAIGKAIKSAGLPDGVFSMVHGVAPAVSLSLVRHPLTRAVGFTGSLRAGRAIFDAASQRPEPIPVYAEMGSVNPVFVLPGLLKERAEEFARGLTQSVTLGAGQFCTCPGVVAGLSDSNLDRMIEAASELIGQTAPATMLSPGILLAYRAGVDRAGRIQGVRRIESKGAPVDTRTEAAAALFVTDSKTFLDHPELGEEVFGPSTVVVACGSREDLERVAARLSGHLTASIHGTAEDMMQHRPLISLLEDRVGRLIFNGFPTGVEVCAAMHHGGPYPATTDVRSTSVGSWAIKRFARPVCYQNFPQEALPADLRDVNHRKIWRLVDNEWTTADIS